MSNATRGFFYNASTQRYQNFESTTPGDVITILHAPSFESSSVDHAPSDIHPFTGPMMRPPRDFPAASRDSAPRR